MKRINLKKDEISIQNIGKQRFLFGILSGFISTISIALIFNKTRELIRFLGSLSHELLIFEKEEITFFNYFFVSLSTVLGLSVTIWIWMGSAINENKKHKLYKDQVRTNVQLFFWLILFLLANLGFLFFIFAFCGSSSYDYPVELYRDHSILFILLPIVVFAQNWFSVRSIYKTGKWILFSGFISLMTIFILHKTTTVDQSIVNNIYFKKYQKHYQYINSEIAKAQKLYDIEFDENAVETLNKRFTEASIKQIWSINQAFSSNKKISIDTIVLQRIIIHNLKKRYRNRYYGEAHTLYNWQYALPRNVLKQIDYHKSNANETKELFNVLREIILVVNKSRIVLSDYKDFRFATKRNEKELKVNIMLVEQLVNVRDNLVNFEKYEDLIKVLPEIKNYSKSHKTND